jgi:hypothetical protein
MSTRVRHAAVSLLLFLAIPGLLQAQQDAAVRLSGELRLRGEVERPAQVDTVDAFTLLRARLGLEAALGERAKVFLQVQDARTFGEESSTVDATADRLDLHQGWLELMRPVGALQLGLRAGRQEVALGNERLIGPVAWSNTGRSFDALRVSLGSAERQWQLTALAATIDERGRRLAGANPGADRSDHTLLGAWLDARLLDAWFLFDRGAEYRNFTGVDRGTVGARLDAPAWRGLTAWAEGSYQFGNQLAGASVEQDIAAYMVGARLAYAFPASPLRSIGLGVDYLSGDDAPADGEYRAFNTMYHTGHKWYGYIDLFLDPAARTGDRGLVDGIASVTMQVARSAPLAVDLHRFWTAAPRALDCGAQPCPPSASDEASALGWELDLTLPLSIGPNQRLQLGYSAYRNGEAAPLAGLGEDGAWWHWGYAMLTFGFSGAVR